MSARVMGPVSAAERQQIELLVDAGVSTVRIAQQQGRAYETVRYHVLRIGACRMHPRPGRAYRRGNTLVQPFSPAEDAFIEALRCQDFGLSEIARLATRRFGHARSRSTIQTRLFALAARAEAAS